jgi:hypothetical protein
MAIYDLSQGMARNLSAQFLGPNHVIDMIPHTGILVFGKEYFFGGGIQAVDPHSFRSSRGMQPVQIQRLGTTRISQADFEAWCQTTGSVRFNAQSYDLLRCNCNNFSHEAALQGLELSQGVPDWILQVPQRFLSSPMGQMIRPMLEQMQVTQTTAPVQAPPSTMRTTTTTMASNSNNQVAGANPWANIPAAAASTPTPTPAATVKPPPPSILKKFTKPMISNDTKSIPICLSKLSPHFADGSAKESLETLGKALQTTTSNSSTSTVDDDVVETTVAELWRLAREGISTSFVLLFLRLVVLNYYHIKSVQDCIEWIVEQFLDKNNGWKTPAARSLAWCVVSNYTSSTKQAPSPNPTTTVDAAICDLSHEAVQVRQAASAFLYNYVLQRRRRRQGEKLEEDIMVSILCSSLESLVEEADATTRLRRLVVGGRVVFGVGADDDDDDQSSTNEAAKALVQDLGFVEVLQELANASSSSSGALLSGDTKECQQLAAELVDRFQ